MNNHTHLPQGLFKAHEIAECVCIQASTISDINYRLFHKAREELGC